RNPKAMLPISWSPIRAPFRSAGKKTRRRPWTHLSALTYPRASAYCEAAMKILVIGGGGREHALAWKLRQSPQVQELWCAPGNGGIAQVAECVPGDPGRVSDLADLAARLGADLTVVGPEQPLV